MADINEILGQQINSVRELKKAISDLQDSLIGVDTESEQYKKTSTQLAAAQAELNKVTKAGKQDNDAAATSVAGMEKQYKELYKTYKNLTAEQRKSPIGKDMAKDLASLSDKLNDVKKRVGNFKDNIGRYADSMTDAFSQMGISIGGLQGPLNLVKGGTHSLGEAFKTLAKNPLMLAITALVAIFSKVAEKIKENEELTNRLKTAFAGIKPIVDAVSNAFNWLVDKVVKVAEGIGKLIEKVLSLNPKLREKIRLSKEAAAANAEVAETEEDTATAVTHYTGAVKKATDATSAYTEAVDSAKTKAEELYQQTIENAKDEVTKLTEKYEDEKALLEKYHLDTTFLTIQYNAKMKEIRDKEAAAELKEQEALQAELDAQLEESINNTIKMYELAAERTQEVWSNSFDAFQSMAASINSVTSAIENVIQAELESGQMTEKEAKRKEKAIKNLQKIQLAVSIASVAADTAAGIMSVWGAYADELKLNAETAAAAGPAAVLTKASLDAKSLASAILRTSNLAVQGGAQIAAAVGGYISKTKTSSAEGGSAGLATVPQVAEASPVQYTTNVQNQSDVDELNTQPIWVSVQDIDSALGKKATLVQETSF